MLKFLIIVFCLMATTYCFQVAALEGREKKIRVYYEVRAAIVEISAELNGFLNSVQTDSNIPDEDMTHVIEMWAAKIVSQRNLPSKITRLVQIVTYFALMALIYEPESEYELLAAKRLLKITVDLKTLLPMNRIFMKASNRTTTYVLKGENLPHFLSCFASPEDDQRTNHSTNFDSMYKFMSFVYPFWIGTIRNLIREDGRLNSEFESPMLMDTETEMALFAILTPEDRQHIAPITSIFRSLVMIGDLDELKYANYLLVRAIIQVADEADEETKKLNKIFWSVLEADGGRGTENEIFNAIEERLKADTVLWERVKDAENELDVLNVKEHGYR